MVERFLAQTSFASQEDFIKNLKINVPENFNFGYDVVDAWAAEQPSRPIFVQHIFQHHLARKRGFPHEGEGEERGKCHDPDTADLY